MFPQQNGEIYKRFLQMDRIETTMCILHQEELYNEIYDRNKKSRTINIKTRINYDGYDLPDINSNKSETAKLNK